MKKTKSKTPKRTCSAEGCGSAARAKGDLCDRHQRMANAPPCALRNCGRPGYARFQGEDPWLCEAHYRRKMRGSKKWDGAMIRTGEQLVLIATRVPPEVREAFDSSLDHDHGESIYGKLGELIDEYLHKRGLHPNDKRRAA